MAQTAGAMELIAQEITQAGQAVGDLGRESARISKVVEVIKEVAEQTNLLALNAAIEAARAGAQGRGFAVVADEVRKLAERTTSSVQDISQTVATMQSSTDSTVNSVEAVVVRAQRGQALSEQAAARIGQIRDSVRQATVSVADVSTALSEQGQAAKDISQHVEAIAHASDASCVIGERTANVSRDLEDAANALRESVGRFKV
ncbi:methyl-accepting chemotaxis protein [Halopseudomonas sp. Lyrl_26]|uniref:methyl-accepting chemotaxis protein n=1 Tax=Halopseudomonas sp. Lyrl_26 TaxID=3110923 RepID=UPI003F7D33B3